MCSVFVCILNNTIVNIIVCVCVCVCVRVCVRACVCIHKKLLQHFIYLFIISMKAMERWISTSSIRWWNVSRAEWRAGNGQNSDSRRSTLGKHSRSVTTRLIEHDFDISVQNCWTRFLGETVPAVTRFWFWIPMVEIWGYTIPRKWTLWGQVTNWFKSLNLSCWNKSTKILNLCQNRRVCSK